MTAATLLSIIESWRVGDCPPEVLCDAISEYGIDVDAHRNNSSYRAYDMIRIHLLGAPGFHSCNDNYIIRNECAAIIAVEAELIKSNACAEALFLQSPVRANLQRIAQRQ